MVSSGGYVTDDVQRDSIGGTCGYMLPPFFLASAPPFLLSAALLFFAAPPFLPLGSLTFFSPQKALSASACFWAERVYIGRTWASKHMGQWARLLGSILTSAAKKAIVTVPCLACWKLVQMKVVTDWLIDCCLLFAHHYCGYHSHSPRRDSMHDLGLLVVVIHDQTWSSWITLYLLDTTVIFFFTCKTCAPAKTPNKNMAHKHRKSCAHGNSIIMKED